MNVHLLFTNRFHFFAVTPIYNYKKKTAIVNKNSKEISSHLSGNFFCLFYAIRYIIINVNKPKLSADFAL